ncbi:MAG: dimethylarginine dimethylaminohydrolase, partial [Polymorphobacter sp.]
MSAPPVSASPVFRFDQALVRTPAPSVVHGLRAGDHEGPSYAGVVAEHAAYVAAFESAGLCVTVLPPLADFPDSVFVEDPALVFGDTAIILNPGAPSRAGEAAHIRPALARQFAQIIELAEGHADGGDILVTAD